MLKLNLGGRKYNVAEKPERKICSTVTYNLQTPARHPEVWGVNGTKGRFNDIYIMEYNRKPLIHLLNLNRKSKDQLHIMILGSGKGEDTLELNKYLKSNKVDCKIDVFNLKKEVFAKSVAKIINQDYSEDIPFEKYSNSKLENKFDLVVSSMGVGIHTYWPELALIKSALMLKPGGKAFVDLRKYPLIELVNAKYHKVSEIYFEHIKLVFDRFMCRHHNKKYVIEVRTTDIFQRTNQLAHDLANSQCVMVWAEITRTR